MIYRMRTLTGAVCALVVPVMASAATCPEGYPDGPVNLLVGFSAGGGTDAIARSIAAEIENAQGWNIVVENKPGAGGDVLMTWMKSAEPDGYTIGIASTNSVVLDPYINEGVDYTWADFDYPATAMEVILGLVALEDRPYDTLEEFIAYAEENGRATVSVSGRLYHLAIEGIGEHFGVDLVPIPGSGSADALQSALGGHVDATVQGSQHIEQIEAGNMVQLSTFGSSRVDYAPDTMTLKESGVELPVDAYTLFSLPKGVDPAIQTCIAEAIDEAINSEGYAGLMANLDNVAFNLGPEASAEFIETRAGEYEAMFAADGS